MSYFEIILLAFALSIDACVVSFSYGLCFRENRIKNMLALAFCTGLFQALMPSLGYCLTSFVKEFISPYSNLIIFIIFVFLGLKFIKEAFEPKEKPSCIALSCLLLIGIATSIDAFSAGISLSLYCNKILKPSILIGLITFVNSCLGFHAGKVLKNIPSKSMEIFAGFILILLGIKALF